MSTDLQPIIDAETVARVLLHGDLKQLTSAQKVSYYNAVCTSVGLNPLTQPFQYLVLNGKEILYARREATEQLRQLHKVSITIVGREMVEDCYVVTARATLPDGRTDENIGAVPLAGLKGETRANNMMKAETKAKRRVTLAICGLGMLDETEVESLPLGALGPGRRQTPPPSEDRPPAMLEDGAAPVADREPDLPEGYVRVVRIDQVPTKNQSVTRHEITLSTGEMVSTINTWLASLAQTYCEERTPVKVKTRQTKFGVDLLALMTEAEAKRPAPEPPPTTDDIPF